MGKCWKCETEITLREEETRCDACGEILRYWCNGCAEPFDVEDKNGEQQALCKWCEFFFCPSCNTCSPNCQKKEVFNFVYGTIFDNKTNRSAEAIIEDVRNVRKIVKYIEELKLGKERRNCINGVPISYAKTRIKSCICKTQGYRVKNIEDKQKFSERLQKVMEIPGGKEMTVEEFRESGSYGQEWRDILNTSICYGWLKVIYKKNKDDEEYALFKRVEEADEEPCSYLDAKNLFVKKCKNCKRNFNIKEEHCDKCVYKNNTKYHKAGDRYELKLIISNEDVCQLPRGEFTKRGEQNGENS